MLNVLIGLMHRQKPKDHHYAKHFKLMQVDEFMRSPDHSLSLSLSPVLYRCWAAWTHCIVYLCARARQRKSEKKAIKIQLYIQLIEPDDSRLTTVSVIVLNYRLLMVCFDPNVSRSIKPAQLVTRISPFKYIIILLEHISAKPQTASMRKNYERRLIFDLFIQNKPITECFSVCFLLLIFFFFIAFEL